MKTYVFQVEMEPDEEGWHIFYPPWRNIGASTWGSTREEALKNIQEVLEMILEDLIEENDPIPEMPEGEGYISATPQVAITV